MPYEFVAGWITLEVRSALHAVGLTSVVAAALAEAGVSCNVIAGYHHDHLLVAHDRVEEAIEVLRRPSARHRRRSLAGLVVRRATISDAPAMRELARSAYARYVSGIGREPAPMIADYPAVIANAEVWVAERAGNLAGFLVLYVRDDHLLVDNVAVSPDAQRSGIGKRLLDLADEWARAAGLSDGTSADDGHTTPRKVGVDQGERTRTPERGVLLREPVTRDYADGVGSSKSR